MPHHIQLLPNLAYHCHICHAGYLIGTLSHTTSMDLGGVGVYMTVLVIYLKRLACPTWYSAYTLLSTNTENETTSLGVLPEAA